MALGFFVVASCGGAVETSRGTGGSGAAGSTHFGGNAGVGGNADAAVESGGIPEDACNLPTDCTLVGASCCGPCEPADETSFIAVNRQAAPSFASKCATTQCGMCPALPPGTASTSQFFFPTCRNGQCAVVDVRQTTATECRSDDDCILRAGAQCCEQCSSDGIIVSINRNRTADLAGLACGAPVACPPCAPLFPKCACPLCAGGRCSVQLPNPDAPCLL